MLSSVSNRPVGLENGARDRARFTIFPGRPYGVRARLLAAVLVLTFAVSGMGAVAWYWLQRANEDISSLHRETLAEIARALTLAKQLGDLTTSAPLLLNARTPYIVAEQSQTFLAELVALEAMVSEQSGPRKWSNQVGRSFLKSTLGTRQLVERLAATARSLADSQDRVRELSRRSGDLERRLAANEIRADSNDDSKQRWRMLRVASATLSAAGAADSLVSAGEYRRRYLRQLDETTGEALDPEQRTLRDELQGIAEGPRGLFVQHDHSLALALSANSLLVAISGAVQELNRSVSEVLSRSEATLSMQREQTSYAITTGQLFVIVGASLALLVAVLTSRYVSRHIARNLESISIAMMALAAGRRDASLPRATKDDEIGLLLRAFRVFRANALKMDRLHQDMRRKTALFESVFNNMTDALVVVDKTGRIIASNARISNVLRLAEPPAAGETLDAMRARSPFFAGEQVLLKPASADVDHETRQLGDLFLEIHRISLPDGRRVWLFSDVTERRRLEERLNRFRRLESLGQLTGEVAHDFNNVLAVVVSNLLMFRGRTEAAGSDDAAIDRALSAAELGTSLTQRLLAFARRQHLQPERVDINELIQGMAELIDYSLGDAVELVMHLVDEPTPVRIDPGQLESALLNLCLNSAHAITGSGRVVIETRLSGNGVCEIRVVDTGCGMSAEILERVFEPFFTTRRNGDGTGLGLSMVFGFIRQSGGEIAIESRPGEGTTVALTLPLTAKNTSSSPEGAAKLDAASGRPIALIVEDNPLMLGTAEEMLGKLGFATLCATDAVAARQMLQGGQALSLLFTDINLGSAGSGWDIVREALDRTPNLAILVTSADPHALCAVSDELRKVAVLPKPYSIRDIRRILGGAGQIAGQDLSLHG